MRIFYLALLAILVGCSPENQAIDSLIKSEVSHSLTEVSREEEWTSLNGDGYKIVKYTIDGKNQVSKKFCESLNMSYGIPKQEAWVIFKLSKWIDVKNKACYGFRKETDQVEAVFIQSEYLYYFLLLR